LQPVLGLIDAGVKAAVPSSGFSADIKMPAIANVSVFHTMLNDRWDFMADAQWTQWSVIQDLTIIRSNGQQLESLPLRFRDTWRLSGGANYRYTNEWMFRGGIAWDQSPVEDQYRGVRLPDADRFWLTAGVQYKLSPAWKFDLGAAYIWVQDGTIAQYGKDAASIAQYGYVNGSYNNNVIIVSGQATFSF
jgi:long-chain fatty acid transport protein